MKKLSSIIKKNYLSQPVLIIFLFGFLIAASFVALYLDAKVIQEKGLIITKLENRNKYNNKILEVEILSLKTSFFVEKYASTLYSKYLKEYWNYVENLENISRIYVFFPDLKTKLESILLLNKVLRHQEIRALKLIFVAYSIPKEVMNPRIANYELSDAELKMSDAEKLKLGLNTLLSYERQNVLNDLENKLEDLKITVDLAYQEKIKDIQDKVAYLKILMIVLDFVICIILIVIFNLIFKD